MELISKLSVTGAANIDIGFNPYTFYTNNNNYMKIELAHDFTGQGASVYGYLYKCSSNWFSFENGTYGCYFNIANTTGIISVNFLPNLRTTDGVTNPISIVMDNGTATATQGSDTQTNTYSGNMPNGNLIFYPSTYSNGYVGEFCGLKIYGASDVLAHHYVGFDDGVDVGIEDLVTGDKYTPTGSGYTIQCEEYTPPTPPTPTSSSKIYLGSTNLVVGKIKLGSNDVSAIYLGANQIYPPLGPIDYFRIVNVDGVSGDITFPQNATNLEYNIDSGAWTNPSTSSVTITLQPNEVLNMRAKSGTTFTIGSSAMTSTFMFDVEGNLATLINGQNPDSVTSLPSEFCRGWFRDQTKIRYADKLHLGTITTVGLNSMYFMFRESSLVKGMDLSNITTFSANNGISTIYYGCTSLTEVTAPSVISSENGNMHRWLDNVSASGNCICPNAYVYNNMPVNSSTIDYGIPSGWTKSYDCRNWENEGYEDKGHCDCEFNYSAEGYTDEDECLCTEFQECVDCSDCDNWSECGYSSYEDCDCQVNENCPEEP